MIAARGTVPFDGRSRNFGYTSRGNKTLNDLVLGTFCVQLHEDLGSRVLTANMLEHSMGVGNRHTNALQVGFSDVCDALYVGGNRGYPDGAFCLRGVFNFEYAVGASNSKLFERDL